MAMFWKSVVVSVGLLLPAQSWAQGPQCAPRADILKSLADKHKEAPVSMGVVSTGALLEVLASASGSWTIIITLPNGPTCMVSSGEGWRSLPIKAKQGAPV